LNYTDKNDKRVLNILSKRTEDVELKKYALQCMGETNTFEYTLKVLKSYEQKILEQIEKLGGNEDLVKILKYLMLQIPKQENLKRL
jgi:geranylgeranyl diphosphate synthase, type III